MSAPDHDVRLGPAHLPDALRAAAFARRLAAVLILLNLAVGGLAVYSVLHDRNQDIRDAEVATANMATGTEQNIAGLLGRVDLVLLSARDEIERQLAVGGVTAEIDEFLVRLAARVPEADGLRMVDAAGRVVHGSRADPGTVIGDRSHFVRARAEAGIIVGQPVIGRIGKKWVLPVARRLSHRDGSFAGIVYVPIPLDRLAQELSRFDVGRHGGIALRDPAMGLILRVPELEGIGAKVGDQSVSQTLKDFVAAGRASATYTAVTPADGRTRTAALRKVGAGPIYVIATLAEEDYLAAWRAQTLRTAELALAFLGVSAWAGWLLTRTWRRRIEAFGALADSRALLAESEQTLREAQEVGRIGSYVYDIAADRWSSSAVLDDIFGIDADYSRDLAGWLYLVHPDERAAMDDYFRATLVAAHRFSRDFRIVRPADGTERWVHGMGEFSYDAQGRPLRLVGVVQDVTGQKLAARELVEGEKRLHALLDASSESTLLLDPVGKVLAINAVGAGRFGLTPAQMKGHNFFDYLPPELARTRRAQLQHVVADGEPTQTHDQRGSISFENNLYPVKDETGTVESVAIYAKDITEQQRIERINAMFHRLDLMLLKWRMNPESIAQQFADEILPVFDLAGTWIGRAEKDGALAPIAMAAQDDEVMVFVEHVRGACAAGDAGCCPPAAAALAGGQMQKVFLQDEAGCAPCRAAAQAAGIEAALLLPLTLRGAHWGALAFYARDRALFERLDIPPRLAGIAGRLCTSLEASLQQEWLTLLDTALETTGNAVFITDAEGHILWVNRAFLELSGYGREELLGQTPKLFSSGVQDAEFYRRFWHTIQSGETWHGEVVNARRDGSHYTVNQTVTPLADSGGGISHYVSILEDISESKAAQARIEHMATFDMLTDLPNRHLFFDRLGQALAMAQREAHSGALLFLDLDRFKQVNDQLGHEAGDLLLKAVAARLREQVRASDTVARLAGDEFTILLPHVATAEDAAHVAAKIVAAIGRPFDLAGREASVGASVGIALYPADGDSVEAVVNAADQAMYLAKQAGRNTYRFREPA